MAKPFPFSVESHRTLGQGFRILLTNGLQKDLRETLESISEIMVALGHYQRGGQYAPSISDIIAARTITQHRLLSLAVTNTGLLGPAYVLAVRPWHTVCLFVSSYAVLLSSFFRFVVLV